MDGVAECTYKRSLGEKHMLTPHDLRAIYIYVITYSCRYLYPNLWENYEILLVKINLLTLRILALLGNIWNKMEECQSWISSACVPASRGSLCGGC